jgi:hypothetical protein
MDIWEGDITLEEDTMEEDTMVIIELTYFTSC